MTREKRSSTEPGDGSKHKKRVRLVLEFGSPPRESSARNEETESTTLENMPSASADRHLGTAATIVLDPHNPSVHNLSATDVITKTAHDHSGRAFLTPLASGSDATMASAFISEEDQNAIRDKVKALIEATDEHPSLKSPLM